MFSLLCYVVFVLIFYVFSVSTPECPKGIEFYHEQYERIARRIVGSIFASQEAQQEIQDPTIYDVAYIAHPSDGDQDLYANYIKDIVESRKIAYGPKLPQEFKYPYIQFEGMKESEDATLTTKHGNLPTTVIDKNRTEWFIFNVYFINVFGQGLKYEEVSKNTDPPTKIIPLDYLRRRLPFELHENDSRFVPISDEDMEFISWLLDMHDSGKFLPGEYMTSGKRPAFLWPSSFFDET